MKKNESEHIFAKLGKYLTTTYNVFLMLVKEYKKWKVFVQYAMDYFIRKNVARIAAPKWKKSVRLRIILGLIVHTWRTMILHKIII